MVQLGAGDDDSDGGGLHQLFVAAATELGTWDSDGGGGGFNQLFGAAAIELGTEDDSDGGGGGGIQVSGAVATKLGCENCIGDVHPGETGTDAATAAAVVGAVAVGTIRWCDEVRWPLILLE